MPDDFTTPFLVELQRAADSIIDEIATDGLKSLKRILDESGFAESDKLKDYEVQVHVGNGKLTYEIILDIEAVNEEDRRHFHKETDAKFEKAEKLVENREDAKDFVRTYNMNPKTGRPQRILGQRDARMKFHDKRKFQRNAKKTESERERPDPLRGSGARYTDHEFKAEAPRGMEIDKDGKLHIAMQREIRNTTKKVIFPKGDFQGIIGKFVDEISDVISDKFSVELNQIIADRIL